MISHSGNKTSTEFSGQLCSIFEDTREELFALAAQAPHNIVESVHLIRKRLKFLRAFIKLTHFISEGNSDKEINICLRDCGRKISGCRDAHVRAILLDEFHRNESSSSLPIEKLIKINKVRIRQVEDELLSENNVFSQIVSDLSKEPVTDYFSDLEPDVRSLLSGHALAYQKSYHAFHSVRASHEAELLHEWRKRTKDLQYQQEIFMRFFPDEIAPFYSEISNLCEILGRINDLYMLSGWMNGLKETVLNSESFFNLTEEIKQEIIVLQKEADQRGHSLYKLTPDEYRHTLEKHLPLL